MPKMSSNEGKIGVGGRTPNTIFYDVILCLNQNTGRQKESFFRMRILDKSQQIWLSL